MTAITTTSADLVEDRSTRPSTRSASLRRGFLVASPILAGILLLVATIADPGAGSTGQEMNQAYTDNPGTLQWHSLTLHWSYAFWGVTAFMAAAYVRGRGSVLANIGAFAGFVGMTTLPGILVIDWYDSSIGQVYGVDAVGSMHEHMDKTLWALPFFAAPGIFGLLLCMPFAVAALWRAGIVRWWAFAAALVGTATFMGSGVTVWGVSLTAVLFTVLGVDLARGTRSPRA
ncbi:MAG: hypothetical protein JWR85_196 [Marmoricola sp.]|nr:hypothetical protein [Marmoricola sp.]